MEHDEYFFSDTFTEDKYMLFELPSEDFLDKVSRGEIRLEFVSTNNSEPLVLCSQDQTFQVLEFDTSNQLLIHDGPEILSALDSTFELHELPPPFLTFRKKLNQSPFTEQEILTGKIESRVSYDYYLQNILCSQVQFENILQELSACEINNVLKVPTPELKDRISDLLYRFSQTLTDWKNINCIHFLNSLSFANSDNPGMQKVILSIVKSLSVEFSEEEAILDESKIVKFLARQVFNKARNGFLLFKEFEDEMKGVLPTDVRFRIDNYYGLFVTEDRGYRYIDEEMLPIPVINRFDALFAIHKEWDAHEIEPFFIHHLPPTKHFNDYAANYARFAEGRWMRL